MPPTPKNPESTQTKGFTTQPIGYWTTSRMQEFMVDIAKQFKMDPFLPKTWYTIPYSAIYHSKVRCLLYYAVINH
jgi:hypothetical protein